MLSCGPFICLFVDMYSFYFSPPDSYYISQRQLGVGLGMRLGSVFPFSFQQQILPADRNKDDMLDRVGRDF